VLVQTGLGLLTEITLNPFHLAERLERKGIQAALANPINNAG